MGAMYKVEQELHRRFYHALANKLISSSLEESKAADGAVPGTPVPSSEASTDAQIEGEEDEEEEIITVDVLLPKRRKGKQRRAARQVSGQVPGSPLRCSTTGSPPRRSSPKPAPGSPIRPPSLPSRPVRVRYNTPP